MKQTMYLLPRDSVEHSSSGRGVQINTGVVSIWTASSGPDLFVYIFSSQTTLDITRRLFTY